MILGSYSSVIFDGCLSLFVLLFAGILRLKTDAANSFTGQLSGPFPEYAA